MRLKVNSWRSISVEYIYIFYSLSLSPISHASVSTHCIRLAHAVHSCVMPLFWNDVVKIYCWHKKTLAKRTRDRNAFYLLTRASVLGHYMAQSVVFDLKCVNEIGECFWSFYSRLFAQLRRAFVLILLPILMNRIALQINLMGN